MGELVKAKLIDLSDQNQEAAIDVQFNPTSLRMSISNKSAGGQQPGSQARQKPGTGEFKVSFDLVFDTADEGDTKRPVSVTRKTQMVERFVRPKSNAPGNSAPPRVKFMWGILEVEGIIDELNIDLDLFSDSGVPLRAKVGVTIHGQNPDLIYKPNLFGSFKQPASATDVPLGAPGTQGQRGNVPGKIVQAMPGESLAQLAARNGLDPSAWRALAANIANPLSLPAGVEIGLPDFLSGAASGGQSAGKDHGRIAAQLPLVDQNSVPKSQIGIAIQPVSAASRADSIRAGHALAQQGGLGGAIAKRRDDAQQSAVAASRTAFGLLPASSSMELPYGSGVPLKPQRGTVGMAAPMTLDTTQPGWNAVPLRTASMIRKPDRLNPNDTCRCACGSGFKR